VEYSCNSSHVLPSRFFWIPNKIFSSPKARQQVLALFFLFLKIPIGADVIFLCLTSCFYVLSNKPVTIAVCSQW
jgi:hypothetical protein